MRPAARATAALVVAALSPGLVPAGPPPAIESVAVLADHPLPVPEGSPGGFRLGGMSDLVPAPGSGAGELAFWGLTDRGPNGTVTEPAVGDAPPRTRRTLPLPRFAPLLVHLSVPAGAGEGEATARLLATLPLSTPGGAPVSGRPAAPHPRAKPIVDPTTLEPVPFDPDGFDPEGLARSPDGRFWIAEEYLPSIAEVDSTGRLRRRFVPRGMALAGASCPVVDSLPADLVRRRDNRGFESLALSPDGSRLFALLQSPLDPEEPAAGTQARAPDLDVPIVVLDPATGRTLGEHAYRLGSGDAETCDWCVAAADGKISAVAALGDRTLLVLEQSDTDLRLYRARLPEADAGPRRRVEKTLVADLSPLAATFQAAVVPGTTAPPQRLSELKFEGMALLGPDRVAIVNDNDFDIAADGGGPASPPARRTCVWVLRLAAPVE